MANALEDVQNTYLTLGDNYLVLRAACQNDAQRATLDQQYVAAQKAYYKCVDQMLADDDPTVADLQKQLEAANDSIDNSVKEMGNISKVIDVVTQAVTIGAKLVTAAGL